MTDTPGRRAMRAVVDLFPTSETERWPAPAIARAARSGIEGLAVRVAEEERELSRLWRHIARAAKHLYDSPCGSTFHEHDPWTRYSDIEQLEDDHVWSLRLLRRAGLICVYSADRRP